VEWSVGSVCDPELVRSRDKGLPDVLGFCTLSLSSLEHVSTRCQCCRGEQSAMKIRSVSVGSGDGVYKRVFGS